MKKYLLIIFLVPALVISGQAQEKRDAFKAPYPYISIASDSSISKQKLIKGFKLCMSDTTFKVVSFNTSYDSGENMYDINSKGAHLDTASSQFKTTIQGISIKSRLFFDNIRVGKNGRFYSLPSFYLVLTD